VRRALVFLALAATTLGASACGVAAKQATADRIIGAAQSALSAGGVAGTLSVQVVPLPGPRPTAPGPQRIRAAKAGPLAMVVYPGRGEAQVSTAAGQPPALIFTPNRMYERRPGPGSSDVQSLLNAAGGGVSNLMVLSAPASASLGALAGGISGLGGSGAQAGGAASGGLGTSRPWVSLDFASLPRQAQDQAAGSFAFNPALLLRLVAGTLTGSVKPTSESRTTTAESAGYRFYRVNFDLDKAEKGMADTSKQVVARVLQANAVTATVFPGEVWLDPHGHLGGFAVSFIQRLDQDTRALQIVIVDLTGTVPSRSVAAPGPDQVISVSSLGALVHGVA